MYLLDESGPALHPTVVSIGMFDGVHQGHRQVLAHLRRQSDRLGVPSVVLTFDPHPRSVLRPQEAPRLISRLERRIELLAETGDVDYCLVLRFDRLRSQEPVDEFVARTLVGRLGMRALVVGENFACGRARRGDVTNLGKLGGTTGFEVFPVPLMCAPNVERSLSCSSTATRRLIQDGDMRTAAALLNRPHEVPGTVRATTAFPTPLMEALLSDDVCLPPAGIYAGEVRLPERPMPGIRSVIHIATQTPNCGRVARIPRSLPVSPGDFICLRFVENL